MSAGKCGALVLPGQRVPIEPVLAKPVLALVHEGYAHGLRLFRVHQLNTSSVSLACSSHMETICSCNLWTEGLSNITSGVPNMGGMGGDYTP